VARLLAAGFFDELNVGFLHRRPHEWGLLGRNADLHQDDMRGGMHDTPGHKNGRPTKDRIMSRRTYSRAAGHRGYILMKVVHRNGGLEDEAALHKNSIRFL
jgi:hypothetical protein